jgi:uncharacterized membrane protein YgcG
MGQWKRTARTAGATLAVATAGALVAQGAASAHDGGQPEAEHLVVSGVVTQVGTDSFTIMHHNQTETIGTTPTTTFAETGTPNAPSGVVMGEEVVVSLLPNAATPTATHVTVLLDRISGRVVTVAAGSLTLAARHHHTRTVITSADTMFFQGKSTATGATAGEFVTAFDTPDATTPGELDALFVDIAPTPVHPVVPLTQPNPNSNHSPGGPPTTAFTPPTVPGQNDRPFEHEQDNDAPEAPEPDDHGDPGAFDHNGDHGGPGGGDFGHGGPGSSGGPGGNFSDGGGNGGGPGGHGG